MKENNILIETYLSILEVDPENLKNGMRRHMKLIDVIKSYSELHEHLRERIQKKYGNLRQRYYPYELSVMCSREKYTPDDFYIGFRDENKSEEFTEWRKDFKNHIIDNEDLHKFWML